MPRKTVLKESGPRWTRPRERPADVLLVDDHPAVREGLKSIIEHDSGLRVCGEAATAAEMSAALGRLHPDLLILDIALPDANGLDLIAHIARTRPRMRILAYSMYDEFLYARRALKAGADGYLHKGESPGKILPAIRHVLRGRKYLSETATQEILTALAGADGENGQRHAALGSLSDRETQVLTLIGRGITTKRIAATLGLSPKTVQTYREHLKTKLGIRDGAQLVRYAVEIAARQR